MSDCLVARAKSSSSLPGVEPVVSLGDDLEGPPSGGLAFHAEPEHLRLFEGAERRPREHVPVEV